MKNSERGIALPTVLVALLALSALALAMTVASRNDVVVSGAQALGMRTLQAADAALNYSLGVANNFANPVDQPMVNLRDQGLPFDATVQVAFEPPTRLPPPGIRVSALKIQFYYFLMNSEGLVKAHTTTEPDSTTRLEMEVTKLGPAGS